MFKRDASQIVEGEFESSEESSATPDPELMPMGEQSTWMVGGVCDCDQDWVCDALTLEQIDVVTEANFEFATIGFKAPFEIWDFMPKAIDPMQVRLIDGNTFEGRVQSHWGNSNFDDVSYSITGQLEPFEATLRTSLSTPEFQCSNVELNFATIAADESFN